MLKTNELFKIKYIFIVYNQSHTLNIQLPYKKRKMMESMRKKNPEQIGCGCEE